MKIDNSKAYFMDIKVHKNFEYDKNSNIKKSIDLFKCENKQLNQIIRFFWQIFRKFSFNVLFSKRQNEDTINIKNAKSININVYFMFHSQFEKQIKQIKKNFNQKLIRESVNSWNFSVLFVKKSIGWKMYIDYRMLNAINVKNKYSLFRIQKCFDKSDFAIYLIKFDLTTKYHQMKIVDVDIFKTVFNICFKKFEYTVMFFELTNVSVIFQIMLKKILRSYLNKFVIVHFDDIVIYFEVYRWAS